MGAASTAAWPARAGVLSAINLGVRFGGHQAVDSVTADFQPGTFTAIVGPNGAGKTTFFNLLSGQLKATSGRVVFAGRDITEVGPAARTAAGIGRGFQLTNLFPRLSVRENVRLALGNRKAGGFDMFRLWQRDFEAIEAADVYLRRLGLSQHADQPASTLSHGGKRRLELAILLALKPEVLMLDEPTAGMSADEVPAILDLLVKLKEEHGRTVLLVEHKLNVIYRLADRILVLHNGRLIADGTPSQVMSSPVVSDAYLGRRSASEARH